MEYHAFLELVREDVERTIGGNAKALVNPIMKNNAIHLDGLSVMGGNENISPTIYLNDYYKEFMEGREIGTIIDEIIDIYERNKLNAPINVSFFTEFEQVKKKIMYKLINYDKNRELLEKVPHVRFLDLAIVFYCLVSDDIFENATILIHNSHMDIWNVDTDELFSIASENTPRQLKGQVRSMEEVMREMLTGELKEEMKTAFSDLEKEEKGLEISEEDFDGFLERILAPPSSVSENAMYVLSNNMKVNGAACLLYQDMLRELAEELDKDLYILPSSIHEVILVPVTYGCSKNDLGRMVREVNETQVADEEVLSDMVYVYSRETGIISM